MASDEFLKRIDEHMARGNEHMARGNQLMERIDEHMTRGNELMEDVREEMRLTREFHERISRENLEFFAQLMAQFNRNTETLTALRDSVLAFMNRLDEGGGAAPA